VKTVKFNATSLSRKAEAQAIGPADASTAVTGKFMKLIIADLRADLQAWRSLTLGPLPTLYG
jgi:hypothetical protein